MEDEQDLINIKSELDETLIPSILEGGAGVAAPTANEKRLNRGQGINSMLNRDMLQIVDSGINRIVQDLKNLLGANNGGIQQVNAEAKAIIDSLNLITTRINDDDRFGNIRGTRGPVDGTRISIQGNDGNKRILFDQNLDPNNNTYNQKVAEIILNGYNVPGINIRKDTIESVDTVGAINYDGPDINLDSEANRNRIQTRLNNCRTLEELYLIKHVELMKTFTFTINLFDKYKYAIKIMLFLLKNLVYKENETPPNCGRVKLPPPLIPNIKTLIIDQQAVQGVITDMKRTVENEPVSSRTRPIPGNELDINANLQNLGAPPPPP